MTPLSPTKAFVEGFRSLWRCKAMAFPVYLANLAVAMLALAPLYVALESLTAHRPATHQLAHTWDLEILIELALDHPELIATLKMSVIIALGVYLLFNQFLIGGVLGVLRTEGRARLRTFGAAAFEHFPRLMWVLIFWLLVPGAGLAVIFFVLLLLAGALPTAGKILVLIPGFVGLAWISAALDYARVEAVTARVTPSFRLMWWGLVAAWRRPFATLALHLGFGFLWLVVAALMILLPDSLDAGGSWAVLFAFIVRQLFIFARVALRIGSLGAHLPLYNSIMSDDREAFLSPAAPATPPTAPAPDPEPGPSA